MPRKRFEEVKPILQAGFPNLTSAAWESNITCWFWRSYTLGKESWLGYALEIASPTVTLRKALLALSLTRFGRLHANPNAIIQGHAVYSQALIHLQSALYDSQLAWNDETLVSVRALVLYEVFETTSDDPSAWQNHLTGMTRLMELRGPHKHRSPMARAVFEDVRYALVSSPVFEYLR